MYKAKKVNVDGNWSVEIYKNHSFYINLPQESEEEAKTLFNQVNKSGEYNHGSTKVRN